MMKNLLTILMSVLIGTCITQAQTVWDVKSMYGTINEATLQSAVNDAIVERSANPDTDIILSLASGTYYLNQQIEFKNFNVSGTGWLIVEGQGEENTILVDTEYDDPSDVTFSFSNPYRLKLRNMTLEGERLCHSQGTIVNKNGNILDVELDDNFPTPNEMYEVETQKANKIRLFVETELNSPHYVEGPLTNDHQELRWTFGGDDSPEGRPVLVSGRTWRFFLTDMSENPFNVGDRVGVSAKSNRGNWGAFSGDGADIVVENVTLKKLSRVKFRRGWNNIRFTNVRIARPTVNGKPAFYASEAGPQFGHDADNLDVNNLIVENCDFRGTVDDGAAFQRVKTGVVRNCYFEDGGGILVGVHCGSGFIFENNEHYHNPLEDDRPGGIHFKGAYNPNAVMQGSTPVSLTWSAGSRTDIHDVYLGTSFPLPQVASTTQSSYSLSDLQDNTTYYWMVNERNTSDNLGVNKSDIWSFTTGSSGGGMPTPGSVVRIENVSNGLWMKSTSSGDYAPVELADHTSTGNKTKWSVEDAGGGYLRFINVYTGRPLRPEQNSVNSTLVVGEITQSGQYTQWTAQEQGSGAFLLTNRKTEMYASPLSSVVGSNIQMVTSQYSSTLWKFIPDYDLKSSDASVSAHSDDSTSMCKLYPNPATSKLTIELNFSSSYKGDVTIFNINGQTLVQKSIVSRMTNVDLSNMQSGVYFVQVTNGSVKGIKKIVVK